MGGYIDHPELPFSEPDTSREAAVSMISAYGAQQQRVYLWAWDHRDTGFTDEEAIAALGMNPSSFRPRRGELVKRGLIEDSGWRRQGKSNRWQKVWTVKEKGPAWTAQMSGDGENHAAIGERS